MAYLSIHPIFAVTLLTCGLAQAQTAAEETKQLTPVVVSGRANALISVSGFGNTPLTERPMQASVLGNTRLLDNGIQHLAEVTRFDASVADAYNSVGYVAYLTVRGFVLDNRFNYRRDGLPINAEAPQTLDNKSSIEILKGTSGTQAGTSAPGGLVNFVVKRPDANFTNLRVGWEQTNSYGAALDWSQRFGQADAFGLRVNLAAQHVDPLTFDASGQRHSLSAAGDWRVSAGTKVEAEFEISHQAQPSAPAFSLLGNQLPDAASIDPRINLNNQSWSQPVVFDSKAISLRVQHRITEQWAVTAHYGHQALSTDDRVAFPYGCTDGDTYYADRYCPNGNFDLYDFRSDDERRTTDALDLKLQGQTQWLGWRHELSAGMLFSRFASRFQGQAYNYAGTGNISGTLATPAAPELTGTNTNRDERSTEFYANDAISFNEQWRAFVGMRATHLSRSSITTNGENIQPQYRQSLVSPWLAVSAKLGPQTMAYASWGQGIESEVTPNRSKYVNAGQALAALKSRQWEFGLKHASASLDASATWFDITRPRSADIGDCIGDNSCLRAIDGESRHRGLEVQTEMKWGSGSIAASAMAMQARNNNASVNKQLNGMRPTNVAERSLKLQAEQRLVGLAPNVLLQAGLVYEGSRAVLQDNSINIPASTLINLGVRYEQKLQKFALVWRAGMDNAANARAWRESPYQYGHAYLYPIQARTLRLGLEARL